MKNFAASKEKFFTAAVIARAGKVCTKTILRRATRESWPRTGAGYAEKFQPPAKLRARCAAIFRQTKPSSLNAFCIGLEHRAEINRALNRFSALLALEAELLAGVPFERSLARVSTTFHATHNSLRHWAAAYSKFGFAGLMEKKRGHSGCKAKGNR
jgi:hypothetical protein